MLKQPKIDFINKSCLCIRAIVVPEIIREGVNTY